MAWTKWEMYTMIDLLIVSTYVLCGIYWIFKREKLGNERFKTSYSVKILKLLMLLTPPLALFIRMGPVNGENLIKIGVIYISVFIMNYAKIILMKRSILSVYENNRRKELEEKFNKEILRARIALVIGTVPAFIMMIAVFLPH